MNISTGKRVRATELLATRGAKAAILAVRRWFKKIATSNTGKTGNEIPIDRLANRENEINEARLVVEKLEEEQRKRIVQALNEDELRSIANENLENELRELMSEIGVTDGDRRA